VRFPRAILSLWLVLLLAVLAVRLGGSDATPRLSAADTAWLDDLQWRAVRYFVEQTDPVTGLVRDRAPVGGGESCAPSSVAATGFGLSAWGVAEARGWMSRDELLQRTRRTLRFVLEQHAQERGWYFHFVDAATGRRVWASEASTIDTSLLLQGALLAREHLRDPEVTRLVNAIYARIDWRWALNAGATLSHGWRPETGFIPHRWDSYAELLGLYLLGLGAPVGPLPEATWTAWRREPRVTQGGRTFIQCGPLFTHQYAHAWFDFRGRRDGAIDYWQNSVDATLAQREWSAAQRQRFPHWSRDLWGLTASDSARGYMAWGTPLPGRAGDDQSDGTVVPSAPGGSLPFAPVECVTALRSMQAAGGARVWGRYGFVDAFNPQTQWASPDVIGISVGITLLMAENLRSGFVWRTFMRAPEVQRGMKRAGFTEGEIKARAPVMATVRSGALQESFR
jgi:hypothetical protein